MGATERGHAMTLLLQSHIVIKVVLLLLLLLLLLRLPQERARGSEGLEGLRVQISGSTPGVDAAAAAAADAAASA